jgi:hypothetical protein
MGDCIPPVIQRLQRKPTAGILRIDLGDLYPDFDIKTPEVCADAAGMGVASVQLAAPREFVAEIPYKPRGRRDHADEMIDALGM